MTPEAYELAQRRLRHRMADAAKKFLEEVYNPVFSDFVRRGMHQSSAIVLTIHAKCDRELHDRAMAGWVLVREVIESEGFIAADDNRAQIRTLVEEAINAGSQDLDDGYGRVGRGIRGDWVQGLSGPRDSAVEAVMAEVDVYLAARRRQRAAIDDELAAPRYRAAREHWRKALAFAEQAKPDLENAVKEVVSAVESLAKVVVGKPAATLGDAIKQLRSQKRVPPGADGVLEGLWTFASAAPGVRHGSAEAAGTTDSDWNFARGTSEAALRFLLDLDSAR